MRQGFAVGCAGGTLLPAGWKVVSRSGWLDLGEQAYIHEWCDANIRGDHHINGGYVWFKQAEDAMLFYLTHAQ